MKEYFVPGINIQWPWSQLLLDGSKTVETRGYALPEKFKGKPLAIIETPGRRGRANGVSKARVVGLIVFSDSFEYPTKKHWLSDFAKHRVPPDDPTFAYQSHTPKWGWLVQSVEILTIPRPAPAKRGHVFARPFQIKVTD